MSKEGPREGDRFGPYRLREQLGEGGMGQVFCADGPGETEVALKLLRPELAKDEGFRKRFQREASVAARVDHPHVVATLDHGEIDGVLYITQQFVRGGSLDARIARDGRLPVADAVRLCLQIGGGLDAMHRAGLVHRDVKPQNILLDAEDRSYVADFGLAKDREASTVLTRLGQALGSLDYMAPEQIRGEDVDARTDVYSLGCVMCECLCGTPPFADRKGMQVMWAHLHDEPPDPRAGRDDISEQLAWAVSRALEKEPEKRPATATAYARMLHVASGVEFAGTGRGS